MTRALFLAFNPAAGILPRDAARLWRVDVDSVPDVARSLELATGAGWSVDGEDIVAVPEDGCDGADTLGDVTIAIGLSSLDVSTAGAFALVSHVPSPTAECSLWQLGIYVLDPARRLCRTFLRWHRADPADTAMYLDGPAFVMPTGPVLLTASRERTANAYVGRFGVNGAAGGRSETTLIIGSGSPPGELGSVRIMGAIDEVNPIGDPVGVVEFVDVQLRAACLEELELVGRRFAELTPKIELAIRRYAGGPMRDVWSQSPTSIVQRELRVQAGLLAYARAELEVVGRYAGPLTSWGELLERWESFCGMPNRAGDGIDERRARLATHLALDGQALDDIRATLAEPFNQDAADVELEEATSVDFEDVFDATATSGGYYSSGHDPEAYVKGNPTQFTFTNNVGSTSKYRINRTLATDDLRWWGRILQATYAPPSDAHPPFLLHPTGEGGPDTYWQTRLTAFTTPADNIMGGLIIGDLEADDWTWIGVVLISGTWSVRWGRHIGEDLGVAASSRHVIAPTAWSGLFATIGAAFSATSIKVRETDTPGSWAVQVVVGADPSDWTVVAEDIIVGATPRPRWGGLGIVGLASSATGALSIEWDYYKEHSPHAPHALTWHAFRDPADGLSYDLAGAQAVLDRYGPAHADATAIDRHRSLVYGDATTLLDRDPIGT